MTPQKSAGKRAAVYNPYWETLGGGERYTASLVKLLLDRGWQVDIWSAKNYSQDILNRFGLDIQAANFTPFPGNYSLLTTHYALLFWLSDGSLPTSFSRKTIVHFQFPFKGVHGHSPKNFLKSRLYTFVVNSVFTKKNIDAEFGVSSRVIYPPVDTSAFPPRAKTNTIFYIGRFSSLTQAKGHETLVNSFIRILPKLPKWKLVLAGGTTVGTDSEVLARLKKQTQGYPIEIVTDPDFSAIKRLISTGKIFWSASGFSAGNVTSPLKLEHFGITVVEAMAGGAVPIITNLGGHKEIVDHNLNGLLWDLPTELEELTLNVIKNKSLLSSLSQAAIAKSRQFDIQEFTTQFARLI